MQEIASLFKYIYRWFTGLFVNRPTKCILIMKSIYRCLGITTWRIWNLRMSGKNILERVSYGEILLYLHHRVLGEYSHSILGISSSCLSGKPRSFPANILKFTPLMRSISFANRPVRHPRYGIKCTAKFQKFLVVGNPGLRSRARACDVWTAGTAASVAGKPLGSSENKLNHWPFA